MTMAASTPVLTLSVPTGANVASATSFTPTAKNAKVRVVFTKIFFNLNKLCSMYVFLLKLNNAVLHTIMILLLS